MSASFYDFQKFAATGIASPEMTHYDKMRALSMAGGKIETLTGVPPLNFKSNGSPLISLSMLGNGQQTGTPTPQSIIMPTFCGVRTGNLLSEKYENRSINGVGAFIIDNNYDLWIGEVVAGQTYTISNMDSVYGFFTAKPLPNTGVTYDGTRGYERSGTAVVTVPSGCTWIAVRVLHNADNAMLNLGSTALPYDPYGWAEKITCAGQTVPVYLGQTQTVRRVKKLVLTGNENWVWRSGEPSNVYFCSNADLGISPLAGYGISNAFAYTEGTGFGTLEDKHFIIGTNNSGIRDTVFIYLGDWKAYLAAQYAAGTPVTVWYVLATEETGIVNEPLAKIGDHADELHITDGEVTIPTVRGQNTLTVDTTIQPSSMTITYTK